MDSNAWIELALDKLGCNQKELSAHLGVSPTQISKWKTDEHMSFEMEKRFRKITGIASMNPEFVVWSGSIESAKKWERLIEELADLASDSAETGYDTPPLTDENDLLCWKTFHTLRGMGIEIPKQFPADLNFDYDGEADFDPADNLYADLIYRIYTAFTDAYGFYAAYISELTFDDDLDLFDVGGEVEACLMELAACKIDVDLGFAPKFSQFRRTTLNNYKDWLSTIKERAFRAGVPLKAELLDLVYEHHDALGQEAEAESFGFNDGRLHPDIYMNELLTGMRVIHKVLPALLKKLNIDEKEFEIDASKLRLD